MMFFQVYQIKSIKYNVIEELIYFLLCNLLTNYNIHDKLNGKIKNIKKEMLTKKCF